MNSKLMKNVFISAVTFLSLYGPAYALADPAPGGPGAPAAWAPAQKSFLGTSASSTSRVYFTGYRGILTEVFYPFWIRRTCKTPNFWSATAAVPGWTRKTATLPLHPAGQAGDAVASPDLE